jgi:hypothetical protein
VSTDLLEAPVTTPAVPPKRKKKRRRRRFSLNGLAIQLAAFALSFTLVALLVVSGSQAAFVEESEAIAEYVPIGTTPPSAERTRGRTTPTAPAPTPAEPAPTEPTIEPEPEPEPEPQPVPEDVVVELTDSDAGTAMFTDGVPLVPGATEERCIEVTYRGDADPRPVRLYGTGISGALAPYLDLTVEIGRAAPGAFGSCATFVRSSTVYSGTLAGFAAAHGSYGTGAPTWNPTEERETRSFRFTVAVQDVPAAAGLSAGFGFSWATRDDA